MSERPDYQEPLPDDAEYPADEDEREDGEDMPLGSDDEDEEEPLEDDDDRPL
ncbi:hypothetical protein AAH450_01200 [Erwinia sp. P7711]|uniref:hypothetical protein n=1 Tax=unclassified Erwinia TaxID=2622719 RepID=UPI00298F7FC8|nr:hypothetical protein [Erwinia sp. MMLR14_017]MDW8846797.1 hypothetical protein [Erwinia sp. MMLR14_017]